MASHPKHASPDHPVHDLIARRWSARAYTDRVPSDDDLRRLFEAARWAPSSFNDQPWRFVVTRRGTEAFDTLVATLTERNQAWAASAPVLGVVAASATLSRNGKPNPHAWHDTGMANALMALQATDLGLSIHLMAGFDRDKAASAMALPDGVEPIAAFAVGEPGGDPASLALEPHRESETKPRARKPIDEFVTWR